MSWKKFLTPVKSMDANAAREKITDADPEALTILDVRQPREYDKGHIPGAKLIPVGELKERINELNPNKETLVYCAIGGRSRVAAQMLSSKGFKKVINMSGGIKAWDSHQAFGPQDGGMHLFTGDESPETVLITAYGLENGLEEFYASMAETVTAEAAKEIFLKLATIEEKHRARLFKQYQEITGGQTSREEFEKHIVTDYLEGGLTTQEYVDRFMIDVSDPTDIVSLAMSIEAQALDLYSRAAENIADAKARSFLQDLAREEKAHLDLLGDLMDKLI